MIPRRQFAAARRVRAACGPHRPRARRVADARLSPVSTLGTPSPSLSRRPPGADSTMPTRRPASWAVVLIAVAVLAACDAGPVVTGPPAVANPTPASVRRVAGAQRGAVQPGELAGERVRVRHGGLHAATSGGSRPRRRARWCSRCARPTARSCPASRTRPWASSTRRRSPSWRRTPTARARWPAPARTGSTSWTPGRERPARRGPATRPRRTPRCRRSSSPGPTTRPSAPSACSRRPSTGSTPPGRPTSTGSRRCPSSPSTRATGSRPPTWGSGPAPAWARSPSGARIAGALDRDTLAD